ncbi:mandelate racemase/muconate lactonizing enzyme family protein [Amycolatopsis acidicola]|uniref:Mandelate racemase/muconate lactonizing enzyme family protein n=1 Tax=Amycolatopsis acidicola TaxID=2596893 RepID=A0A5N0UIN2_9PSEU|nr:mandelate racemase/muconate lactonizing enzyme family protein [Amycolatopsis acidicola]KAA9148668.1 mandelate racemase/muconate lactonizing enzyme family protein [Amycolatopsis acidicola]
MPIADVTTYVLKLAGRQAYLGKLEDGTELSEDRGYVVREPWRSLYSGRFETMLVRITTDDGTVGWGEALAPVAPEVTAAIVDRMLGPWLTGREVTGVRPLWNGLRDLMRERGHLVGHQADALAAVDIALWDLYGKLVGLPVARLLGGAVRDHIPAYVSGLARPTDPERAALAADWESQGATMVKLAAGKGIAADLATFDAVAAAAPSMKIAVDAHWAYRIGEAVELGQELDRRGALFFEAPLVPEDVAGHAELATRCTTPVAVGEALRNRYEFADWLGRRALRLAQPDVARTGITEAMSIVEVCSAHHVPVACHHSVGLGVSLAAGVHVSAASTDTPFFEYQPDTIPVAQRILRAPLPAGPTGFGLPTGPGLGIDVDADLVATLAKEN